MLSKLSKEQLVQLALYTTGINTILLEALLTSPEAEDEKEETEVEILVVEIERVPKNEKGKDSQK